MWSILGLQEGATVTIELINYFHDHMMMLLTSIITFVSYAFILVLLSLNIDRMLLDSHFLELIWTLIPIVFLVFIALPSLYLLYITEDFSSYNLSVKSVAHQWYWEYEYHIGLNIISFNSYILTDSSTMFRLLDVDNRLCLPYLLNTMVVVTSADVLHSWAVPSLGVNADAIPGRLNYVNVNPSQYGVFYGQCSELCGTNHSFIPIVVEVCGVSQIVDHANSFI